MGKNCLLTSRSSPERFRLPIVALVIACSAAACSGGDTTVESNTPQIQSGAKKLEPGLVTLRDLAEVPGLPKLTTTPTADAPLFENPDPRAPCGAPIEQPDLSKGAVGVLSSNALDLVSSVVSLGEVEATRFMDATLADARPGCAPYESTTNQGTTQTVNPEIVEVPPVGDQRFAQTATIEVQGQTLYTGAALVRNGGILATSLIFSQVPVDPDTVAALTSAVNAAADRVAQ